MTALEMLPFLLLLMTVLVMLLAAAAGTCVRVMSWRAACKAHIAPFHGDDK